MDSNSLKTLLRQYDTKRTRIIKESEQRKKDLYSCYPRLEEIEKSLSLLAISTAKSMLNKNDPKLLKKFNSSIAELKKEKLKILHDIGKEEEYLLPQYECNSCMDTGYILENSETRMCHCLRQKLFDLKYNKSNMYNLEKQNFSTFLSTIYSDDVDEKKYKSNISPRKNIELIKNICLSFIQNFEDPQQKNLLFTGNTGLGKTFLSSCIANEVIKKGKTVLYQTSPVMLDSILDYRFGKIDDNDSILNNLLNVDLLIIDDLGTEHMNHIKFSELFNIINTRLLNSNKQSTKTIISTNLSLQNLFSTYDERIISRIVGNYQICYFFGEDLRFKLR